MMPTASLGRTWPFRIAVVVGVFLGAACSSGGGGDASDGGTGGGAVRDNQTDLEDLAAAMAVQYEGYAELLALASEEGTRPLFDATVNVDEPYSPALLAKYDRLYAVVDALIASQAAFAEATASLEAKAARARANGERGGVSVLRRAVLGAVAGFFEWATGARERTRQDIVAVMNASSGAARQELFDLARDKLAAGELGNPNVDIGATPDEFAAKIASRELDGLVSYSNLHKEAANTLVDYAGVAADLKSRPVDKLVKEGAEGLSRGVDVVVDVGKTVVSAGLGSAGPSFEQGFDKAADMVEKVNAAESAAAAPIQYLTDRATQELGERVAGYLGERVELPEGTVGAIKDGIDAAVGGFVQNVTAGEWQAEGTPDVVGEVLGSGWGMAGVELDLTGALEGVVAEVTTAAASVLIVQPGAVADGDTMLVPGDSEVRLIGLGGGEGVTTADPVSAAANQTTTVALEDAGSGWGEGEGEGEAEAEAEAEGEGECSDACQYAGDGECDDGGPGSDYDLCDYGTDCADCGEREAEENGEPDGGTSTEGPAFTCSTWTTRTCVPYDGTWEELQGLGSQTSYTLTPLCEALGYTFSGSTAGTIFETEDECWAACESCDGCDPAKVCEH